MTSPLVTTPRWPRRRQLAFSLLEVIGVLAVLAVLASILFPAWIQRLDRAARTKEVASLTVISNALVLQVLRSNTIPDQGQWSAAVATWSPFPVAKVVTNPRRYPRLYFFQATPNTPALPGTQSAEGTSQPRRLRALVVSTLGGDPLDASNCPNPNGGALADSEFDLLWNTPDHSRPTAGLWANWNGRAEDFLIQRLDYAPLFHHLVLVNRDFNFEATFTINGSSPIAVTNYSLLNLPNLGWDRYYLDGTVVGLCNGAGAPQTRYVLTRDISFVFEEDLWRAQIMGMSASSGLADDFAKKAAQFLAAQWYSGAHQGGDQQGALTAMYSFMYTYTLWANQTPHFPSHGAPAQQVPEFEMLQDVGDDNKRLDEFTGSGGLLK